MPWAGAHDGATERNALAVTTGQSADRLVKDGCNAKDACNFLDPLADLVLGHSLACQRIGNVLAHIHVRIKRKHLEDERDIALGSSFIPTSSPSM